MRCDYCINEYYDYSISLNISNSKIEVVNFNVLCVYVMCCFLKKRAIN